jgi:hypothetical protein
VHGLDTIAGVTFAVPVDCSTPTTILQQPLFDGDIVVHDAAPLRGLFGKPTSAPPSAP